MHCHRNLTSLLNWGDNDNGIGGQLFNALKQVIHSKKFPAVGGLVTLVNNGNGAGFQTPALTDMLYDWPYPMSYEGEVDLNASINLRVSGENDLQSTNLFGSAYPGLSLLGYYFLAGKLAVLFVPLETQLADHVVILRNVEPNELVVRMKEQLGFDYLWQLGIASPQRTDMSSAEGEEGIALAFYVHANTFPKTGEKIVGKPLKLRFPGVPLV